MKIDAVLIDAQLHFEVEKDAGLYWARNLYGEICFVATSLNELCYMMEEVVDRYC